MSTQKWSDDDLDDLFRKSSEEADPTYDPVAWQDLQTRLNDRDRERLRTRLLRWGLPVLLLLLVSTGSIIWYTRPRVIHTSMGTTTTVEKIKPTVSGSLTLSDRSVSASPLSSKQSPADASVSSTASQRTTGNVNPAPMGQSVNRAQPSSVGRPTDGFTGKSGRSKQRTNDLIAHQPAGTATPNDTRTPADRASTKRAGSESVNNRLVDQPDGVETQQPERRSAPEKIATQPSRATQPGSLVATGTTPNPVVNDRLTSQTKRPATSNVQSLSFANRANKRILVSDRRFSHLTNTARQDAKTGGLGRQRSVVPGLVTDQTRSGPAKNTILTNEEYYSKPTIDTVTTPQVPAWLVNRFVWPAVDVLPIKPINWPSSPAIEVEPVRPANTRLASSRFRQPDVSVQLVVSPDFSTVGLKNFDRPGSNIGVLVQYQLSERFSVQTGALWSTKVYTAKPSEYNSPVYMHVVPESVTGRCTMFDMPLNLRYDVLLRPGGVSRGPRRWFASGGITSYFVDHEVYSYNFMNPNDPTITAKGWDNKAAGRKGGNFGLSNLNISVGYEQPISRRLSWQIEPFMKVPLQPIGSFKVKLLSTGTFFSLRYRL